MLQADYGGPSQPFKFMGIKYNFRLTVLPLEVTPGAINISQMMMTKVPSPPPLPPSLQYSALGQSNDFMRSSGEKGLYLFVC